MKVVVVALLLLVAVFARAEDNLQYEQAAYQDSAAEASEQLAEQQQVQQAAEAEAEGEAEAEDVESQAVADADSQEAEVEVVEDAEEAQEQAADAEAEMVEGEAEAEGEQAEEEAQEEVAENEEAAAFVESDAEAEADLPKLPHPAKTLSALAHKASKGIQKLRKWVASRQGKKKGRGGVAPPPRGKGKKFPRRLPPKPVKKRKLPALKKRPNGVKPKPAPKKKGKKLIKKLKKLAKKAGKKVKKVLKKLAKLPSKLAKKLLKLKARRAKRKAQRKLRPWKRIVAKKLFRRPAPKKRKIRLVKRPPPPPTADNRIWHSERWVSKEHDPNQDPEMAKLNLALAAVKEDILATNKQINDERRWSIAVHKIVTSYKGKLSRVDSHIIALRKEMKALYRKKKQIENLKLQRALEAKLKEARGELKLLTNSLKHVAIKQGQLNRSGMDLRATIAGIQGQLAKLRGQRMFKKKKCGKGKRFSKKKGRCVRRKGRKGGKGRKGRKGRKAARKLRRMLKRK